MAIRVVAQPLSFYVTCEECKARLAYELSDVTQVNEPYIHPLEVTNEVSMRRIRVIWCPLCRHRIEL
jgi:uncharacterized protein YlaI